MAVLTISGDAASRWEDVAQGAAQLLGFDLVTEARLAKWIGEEFGDASIPPRAWRFAALAVLARLAREHHVVIAAEASEQLFRPMPGLLRARITASAAQRGGNLMIDRRLEKPEALALLRELDAEQKRLRKARSGRATPRDSGFDLTIHLSEIDVEQAADILAAAQKCAGLRTFSALAADELMFAARLELARRGIVPAGRAEVKPIRFGHPSEEMFAHLLDFYRIRWEYEPRSFDLQWDKDGKVTEAFTPDFYLPEFDLYIELTTMKQSLVTRKNRKIKLLKSIYPHVHIQVFYQRDFQDLVFKYGLEMAAS